MRNKVGTVVRALTPHQCDLDLIPGTGVIGGLRLLLVISHPYTESFFSWFSSSPISSKTNTAELQFNLFSVD